ncbi:hypothetical protein TWF281_004872 [Arthrobotrys megalospora]
MAAIGLFPTNAVLSKLANVTNVEDCEFETPPSRSSLIAPETTPTPSLPSTTTTSTTTTTTTTPKATVPHIYGDIPITPSALHPRQSPTPLQIDQTPGAALQRAKRHLPQTIYSQISTGTLSMRIINIYRPLLPSESKITDHQLVLSESNSILDEDLIPVEHVYPDRVGQTYAVRHAEGQRFWYWSDMDNTEGIIVQVYDSLFGCDSYGDERGIRAATGFFKLMPQGCDEGWEAEWLVVRALVVA